ncbi:hypothetical protein [Acinetobacter lwoffii]|uniref:hypothetical protein n=1 Tax=Acinetobacter lwoffii TaxID=28090 RepID=UPI003F91A868
MNTKVDEGKLISGKEALIKVAEGIVQYKCDDEPVADRWTTITGDFWDQYSLGIFLNEGTTWKFRLKPRTIKINEIEVPACGVDYKPHTFMFVLNSLEPCEYSKIILDESDEIPPYWWSTEEEIKQVVAALRQVFGGSHDN